MLVPTQAGTRRAKRNRRESGRSRWVCGRFNTGTEDADLGVSRGVCLRPARQNLNRFCRGLRRFRFRFYHYPVQVVSTPPFSQGCVRDAAPTWGMAGRAGQRGLPLRWASALGSPQPCPLHDLLQPRQGLSLPRLWVHPSPTGTLVTKYFLSTDYAVRETQGSPGAPGTQGSWGRETVDSSHR